MTTSAVPRPSSIGTLATAAGDIKLAHSIFAMPFAILAAFLAWPRAERGVAAFAGQLLLVVVCMVCARTWAMLVNRLADARFDAANPRTARRAIPSGQLGRGVAGWMVGAAGALFVGGASLFWVLYGNPWPALLSVPVLGWIALYSFTKRFTALCHLFLGGALAASPVAAAIAVDGMGPFAGTGPMPAPGVAILLLAGMVTLWVAGFDVIYALQDIAFDREHGLHSVPARLGWRGGAWVSRVLHAGAWGLLVGAWRVEPRLGWPFGVGVAVVGAVLVSEHLVLARRGKAGLDMAFFTLNGVVSCVLGLAGVVDLLV
jgi:4-hydroxybenzoate polyprenyltransferase